MLVIPVYRVVDPKKLLAKNEGLRRRRGQRVTDTPPHPHKKERKLKSFFDTKTFL
jgi:hypothetical protein